MHLFQIVLTVLKQVHVQQLNPHALQLCALQVAPLLQRYEQPKLGCEELRYENDLALLLPRVAVVETVQL